ncbi:MAG: metalloregulator ArsR/SmtB family transcription factor [Thermoplasmata archaeon]
MTKNICKLKNIESVNINDFEKMEEILKTLSNKTRLSILSICLKYNEVCACELESALNIPQSTITTHLLKLYRSGILRKKEEWKFTYYSIDEKFIPLIKCIFKISR